MGSLNESPSPTLTTAQVPVELDAGFRSAEQIWQVEALVRGVNRIAGQTESDEGHVDAVRAGEGADKGDGAPRRQQDGLTAEHGPARRPYRPRHRCPRIQGVGRATAPDEQPAAHPGWHARPEMPS